MTSIDNVNLTPYLFSVIQLKLELRSIKNLQSLRENIFHSDASVIEEMWSSTFSLESRAEINPTTSESKWISIQEGTGIRIRVRIDEKKVIWLAFFNCRRPAINWWRKSDYYEVETLQVGFLM
jgi:hypothetical protein